MRGIWIGLALALTAPAASAQAQQQPNLCFSDTATDDQKIDACTALIQSPRNPLGQAVAYVIRSVAYENKGLYDQVIADDTQAIALWPDYAAAYYYRGIAYEKKGLRDPAVADYRAAWKLDPDHQQAARDALTRLGVTP